MNEEAAASGNDDQRAGEQGEKGFGVERIVLKDLSFETPMGQEAYTLEWKPDCRVVLGHRLGPTRPGGIWEVILTAQITAKLEGKTAFLVEVEYAGVFRNNGLTRPELRRALVVDASRSIFPYLRESIYSVILKGGFPAVNVVEPDFEAWFNDQNKSHSVSAANPSKF